MIDFSTPLAGMNAAADSLNRVAANVANIGGNPVGDSVDLGAEAVAMIEAKNAFAANAQVAHTADEMTLALLNILA
ncbi:MAG TPA: flagellar basal body rod C-terminal domain-containing protein [Bryobacteraceae bacterium]|nr:flagellar basal body rod C-terminal domain-containing protein [Bryobacteraceae bacterium]